MDSPRRSRRWPGWPRVPGRGSVAATTVEFGLVGLVVVLVIAAGATAELRSVSRREAIREAKQLTRLAGSGIVAPTLTPATLAGTPAALATLDRVVRDHVLREPVVRVKLWTTDGRIVYSDEPRLIGKRFHLAAPEVDAVQRRIVDASVSDLDEPENRYEQPFGKLLQVYLPVHGPGGQLLLYEDYLRFSAIAGSQRRQFSALAPPVVGGLLLLWLAQLPVAWSLARRLRQRQLEREGLLLHALDASAAQRRQIASELHGGVIQSIAGLSFGLGGIAARVAASPARDEAPAIRAAADEARRAVGTLRNALMGIYEPAPERVGLAASLRELAGGLRRDGVTVTVRVPERLDVDGAAQTLLAQVGREVLGNVRRHAGAREVEVTVEVDGPLARLVVTDDGAGFTSEQATASEAEGHFGLRLVEDLLAARGGRLDVRSVVGQGTTVRAEVPA